MEINIFSGLTLHQVVHEEKAATLPPRLGKQKFEPASVQVILFHFYNYSLALLLASGPYLA